MTDCIDCDVKDKCTTCITGKYSNDDGNCVKCPDICTSCIKVNDC